jgi:hypothetical protein
MVAKSAGKRETKGLYDPDLLDPRGFGLPA